MSEFDHVHPFLFENLDIRGAIVCLEEAWVSLKSGRDYPLPVAHLLGEMSAVTALIAANLKQPGRMTFQLQGAGPVNHLVLDCDEQLRLRGMAHWQAVVPQSPVPELLGHGQLALTLETTDRHHPYQSLVPLQGDSVAAIFEHYLAQSEQQATRLLLAAGATRATGLFLQKLPSADAHDPDGWNRIQHLLATLKPAEMLTLEPLELLRHLFPEESIRVFPARPVRHHCPEDREKIQRLLLGLGQTECEDILNEHGEILIRDDLCNHDYHFDPEEVAALFVAPTLH